MFEILKQTYALAAPGVSQAEIDSVIEMALDRARAKHSDFERFTPAIEHLSTVIFTDHKRIPLDDYLETLYCGVKHGDFSRSWRLELKRPAPPPS